MADTTLTDILNRIGELEGKVIEAKAQKEETPDKGWVGQLIAWLVGLVVAAGIAIGAYFLLRDLKKKNEELAKLRTENEQDKVRQANLEHEAAVASHMDRVAELRTEALELEERIEARDRKIVATQSLHDHAIERIRAAQNWEALDALNEEGR